ncbi:MAG: endonuclease [Pseudomonadota bacterium]
MRRRAIPLTLFLIGFAGPVAAQPTGDVQDESHNPLLHQALVPARLAYPFPPDNLDGEALRDWLRANWHEGVHQSVGYDQARRAMYSSIDVGSDGRVRGVYSGFSQPAADVTFLDPINTEHTVPQSWFGRRNPMRSDIHHLFPTHKDANSARDSDPFCEIKDSETRTWFGVDAFGNLRKLSTPPLSAIDEHGDDQIGEFEPPETQKGDTARAIFYFFTM